MGISHVPDVVPRYWNADADRPSADSSISATCALVYDSLCICGVSVSSQTRNSVKWRFHINLHHFVLDSLVGSCREIFPLAFIIKTRIWKHTLFHKTPSLSKLILQSFYTKSSCLFSGTTLAGMFARKKKNAPSPKHRKSLCSKIHLTLKVPSFSVRKSNSYPWSCACFSFSSVAEAHLEWDHTFCIKISSSFIRSLLYCN